MIVLFSSVVKAQTAEPSQDQARQLINAAGIELQIQQIPKALGQAGHQQSGPAATFIQPMMQTLQSVFVPEKMLETLTDKLTRRLDVPTMLDALTWYQSSNGRDIINAQKAMLQPDVMERVARAMTEGMPEMPDDRRALLNDIASSTQSTEIALDTMVSIQAAFMSALSSMITPQQAQGFDQLKTSFNASKDKMRSQVGDSLLIQQSVLLQSLPDETLKEFLRFAKSQSGQTFFDALNTSLDETIAIYARQIPDVVQQRKSTLQK